MKNKLLKWYDQNNYEFPWRNCNDPYKTWISEVMLQQTQVKTAKPYFDKWMLRFPTVIDVANSDIDIILKYWEGLGYYSRAHNIKKASDIICNTMNNKLPDNEKLKDLPGIGDYMYGAIMSIAFSKPLSAIDGNVKRVFSRLLCKNFESTQDIRELKEYIENKIHKKRPGCFNQAIMDLGREICKPSNPICIECPIKKICKAYNQKVIFDYPKKTIRKSVPSFDVVVGFITDKDKNFLITKRPKNKMLGGLWELPGGKREKGESLKNGLIRELKEEINVDVGVDRKIGMIQHSYSHMNIKLHGYECNIKKGAIKKNQCDDLKWINVSQINRYTFPKANHKLFSIIKDYYVS
tara:strand:- start:1269 stop:2321 length:1053 start_codon:yes stop_codon:yes gene_type:complete